MTNGAEMGGAIPIQRSQLLEVLVLTPDGAQNKGLLIIMPFQKVPKYRYFMMEPYF